MPLYFFLMLSLCSTPAEAAPSFAPIDDVTLLGGSPLHIPLDGLVTNGQALSYSVVSSNPLVETFIPEGNRSLLISVAGYGDMCFELFEGRAPRVTEQIIALAEDGFYDGLLFHRIIDNFIIQGGDPTGAGSGGSDREMFDDQYHVDLQHNRSGVLSMAKAGDDTNNSQFFITECPARHLDFAHSIFGQLVAGESVRETLSGVPTTGGLGRPVDDVVMQSVDVLYDNENAVLMLKAPEGARGNTDITVIVTDTDNNQFEQTFHVTIEPDTINGTSFLADIPEVKTDVDAPVTFQLTAIDVEGDSVFFLDQMTLYQHNQDAFHRHVEAVSGIAHPDLDYSVDFNSGLVTVTPTNGLTGVHEIFVATSDKDYWGYYPSSGYLFFDYQYVSINIVPEPSSMTFAPIISLFLFVYFFQEQLRRTWAGQNDGGK